MKIRRLLAVDAVPYRALMLEAYCAHPDAFTSSAAERADLPMAWWQARLAGDEDAPSVVLGAFQDGQLAGVAGICFESRLKTCHKAKLFGMYVPAECRRHGIGAGLVNAALAQAGARAGVRLVQLTVTQGNRAAEELYRKCGFRPFGVEPHAVAVGSGFVAKVHMWRGLDPELEQAAWTAHGA